MGCLSLIVVNANGTFTTESVAPETFNASGILGMCKQEPETKNWLGQDVENSVRNDLGVNGQFTRSITKSPNNRVQRPDDESKSSDGSEKLDSRAVLGYDRSSTWNCQLVHNNQVGNACKSIISPFLEVSITEGCKKTKQDHDEISNHGNKDVGTVQAGKE